MKKEVLNIKIKKYCNGLFYRIIISILTLILLFLFYKTNLFNDTFNIFNNINLLKIPYSITQVLPEQYHINDVEVFDNLVYDNIKFDGSKNQIISYNFDGVYNIIDGIIVNIKKNNDNSYNVSIQDVNGFLYEYCNLKSVDLSIYTFVKSQTIIGRSEYSSIHNYYHFDLYVSKRGEYYDLYKMAES